jgi:hypothetical protein
MKIASAHGKTKSDCKRQAAFKSVNLLTKIFPIIQVIKLFLYYIDKSLQYQIA